jgi:two-component system, OmpR family, sensor histidine kinase ChvG
LAIATAKADASLSLRRFLARLWIRLLAFNVLLVFLPAAGISYLNIFERQLLQAQEDSMVQQGRLLAAALSERGPLARTLAEPILARLERQTPSRIRVLDGDGWLVCDTSRLGLPGAPAGLDAEESQLAETDPRSGFLYRVGSGLFRLVGPLLSGPRQEIGLTREEAYSPDAPFEGSEIRQARSGSYGAATRITRGGQRSVTLYSALPVRNEGEVVGVVLVSQSTFHILQDLYEVRLAVFRYVVGAMGVAAILSLMLSATISRPIEKLRAQAKTLVGRGGRLTGRFPGSRRLDEIGDLSRALSELSSRLEERMRFIESFAADVSHEFKNPLTSIRAAAEMLKDVEDREERARFAGVVEGEIARLERLLSSVREVTLVDSELEEPEVETVDLVDLLKGLAGAPRYRERGIEIELEAPSTGVEVRAPGHRLAQVFENLLDNALGFTPDQGRIRVELRTEGRDAVVRVEDQGPGLPEEHRQRIFDRFFTYRPNDGRAREHTGLGLSIVKTVVERYGGSVALVDSSPGGAAFEVRLGRV